MHCNGALLFWTDAPQCAVILNWCTTVCCARLFTGTRMRDKMTRWHEKEKQLATFSDKEPALAVWGFRVNCMGIRLWHLSQEFVPYLCPRRGKEQIALTERGNGFMYIFLIVPYDTKIWEYVFYYFIKTNVFYLLDWVDLYEGGSYDLEPRMKKKGWEQGLERCFTRYLERYLARYILIYLTYLICLTLSQCHWKDIETRPGGSFVWIPHWVVELLIWWFGWPLGKLGVSYWVTEILGVSYWQSEKV